MYLYKLGLGKVSYFKGVCVNLEESLLVFRQTGVRS